MITAFPKAGPLKTKSRKVKISLHHTDGSMTSGPKYIFHPEILDDPFIKQAIHEKKEKDKKQKKQK